MSQTLNTQVEQLRAQFLAGLPQRAHQVEDLWHRLRYLNWSDQGLKTLHMLVHRLVGSGTSFGFPDISSCAQILDSYLQDHEQMRQTLGGIEREMIDQMVASLVRVLTTVQPQVAPAATNVPIKTGGGKRIFVVDDDRALSALMATYLRGSGFDVQQFDTPTACIQQLDAQPPHAILMDVGFHGESVQGLEAVEHIKIRLGNTVPIILLSARSDMHARLRALRAGCTNYLTKPIDFLRLVNTLSITINSFESTHRVMVVDDDEIVAKYHAELLRHAGMEVISVSQPLQSLQRAAKFKPDLVILDMHMPEINGIELATLLRQEEEFLVLPIIFVTSDTSESLRESLESLGVNGIMHKPVQIDALVSTCERAINDTIALKNRMARVTQRAAHRQQITRSYFFGAIDNELQTQPVEGQQSNNEHTALYYIGIDTMESLYEQFGQTGIVNLHEQLCTLLSQIIASEEQWTDISNLVVCVLTGHRTHEQHQQRAAQIIAQLRSHDYEFSGAKLTLDVSIGITYLDNEHGSANSALLHAEKAYDAARTQGGNRELEYEIEETEIVGGGLDIDFKQGLPAENLSISYQPMISLEEQQIEHYEALVRWKTEAEELIPAAKFLHYIEHSSMRIELDRWVLQTAISAIVNNSNTRETASLFIHLAEETLQQNSFFSFAANVFRSSRLRGDRRLIFMLSEPWVNTQTAQAEIIIKALRDINCGICLTQTGSTSASEHIMNTYQFEYVKLAPRLTANLEANGEPIIELKKITKIAKAAGSKIIATQVEDSKNLSTLWLQGVRLFQGFFIQSPEQEFSTHNDMEFYEAAHKRF